MRAPTEGCFEVLGLSTLSVSYLNVFKFWPRIPHGFPPVWPKCKAVCYPANIWQMCVIFLVRVVGGDMQCNMSIIRHRLCQRQG